MYRAIKSGTFDILDYQEGSIGNWPYFAYATPNKQLAKHISRQLNKDNGKVIIFKIFLSSYNDPITAI